LWAIRNWRDGRFIPQTPLDISLFVFLLTLLISLAVSYDLTLSLPKIIGVVFGVALFYALAIGRSFRHLQFGLAVFLLAGLAIVLVSLMGTNWETKLPGFATLVAHIPQLINNIPGAVDGFSPNEVAGTLLWFLPLTLTLALSPLTTSHNITSAKIANLLLILLLWGFALLTTAIFVLTQSRSGYIGLAVAGLVILWGSLHKHKLIAWGLLILVIGLTYGLISLVGWQQISQLLLPFGNDAVTAEGITLTSRVEIWARAIYAIRDFPLTGVGMNLFRTIAPILYPFFTLSADIDIAHAHNQFLQVGLDEGIPGLIAYIAIWLGLASMLWQSWRLSTDSRSRTLTLGFIASLMASFVFGLTDAVALGAKPGFMFWFLLGLITGHYRLLVGANDGDNGF
jgi:putative inorganic carbon (HCO3(-)) transporter